VGALITRVLGTAMPCSGPPGWGVSPSANCSAVCHPPPPRPPRTRMDAQTHSQVHPALLR